MRKVLNLLLFASILLFANACKNKSEVVSKNVNAYGDYITGYPEQYISNTATLEFLLKKSVSVSSVSNDVISIQPAVKGNVVLSNNILSFVPDEQFQNDQEYTVTLHLSKLYNDAKGDLKDFVITTQTKELLFTVALESPKMHDKNWNYVDGYINASDAFDVTKLPPVITAEYLGDKVPVSFELVSGFASKVFFKIDSLKRFKNDKKLHVEWNGTAIKSKSKGESTVKITGKNVFKVVDVKVSSDKQQRIDISFSDPVKKSQNLKGLIQFTNAPKNNFLYKINQNVVTIYPSASFKKSVVLEVFKGLKNASNFMLKENFKQELFFEEPKPSISFIKSGSILPNSQNLKINFNAVNLRAVDVTVYKIFKDNVLQFLQQNNLTSTSNLRYVGRPMVKYTINLADKGLDLEKNNAFSVDLATLVEIEEGAMYRVEISFSKDYSNYTCEGKKTSNTIKFGKKEIDAKYYDTTEYSSYYYGEYNWRDRDNPCMFSYYYNKEISTNILASNLGVIVKKGNNNSIFVAVTDLLTAEPVGGAMVRLYNLQKQVLASAETDDKGVAVFREHSNCFFAVVSKGKNTTYIKLDDGNSLSMSRFGVSGAKIQKGIKGYIYAERGVWRPSDQLFLTFVLNDKENPLPENHPIKFELINPQGKIINREILHKNESSVYAYAPKTADDALTGNWRVKVSVGGATFHKNIKIETIKPNRLKIKLKTPTKILEANALVAGDIEVKWLHGAIARGLKLDINGKFYPTKTAFKKFENYHFDDITRTFQTEEFTVLSGHLDEDGKTHFSVQPKLENKPAGKLKISLITKVYENGGDFSTDVFTQEVSPYRSYVGLNPAEEQQSKNYLFTDENYAFNVVSVNQEGKGIRNNLKIKVYRLSWSWWWSTSDNGLSSYDGTSQHEPFLTKQITTNANGKGTFNLKIDKNDWGRYLVKVIDTKSGHATSEVVYFDWPSWYGKKRGSQDKSNATMLVFTTDKESYKLNETATVKFPSSKGGRALVTIENGTEVLDYFWVETAEKQTEFSFPVLAKYTPNVFVNISLLQQHSQTVNDLPIRMYGSVPMLVNDPDTKLEPQIEMPDEIQPESTVGINVKEKNGKPMTYTIALVDDGLLDLTRFRTPNPWHIFYAKQSLGVKTWDVFDDVIGAYGGKINQILSIGGDESEAGSKNKKANRFQPMVVYLGPFTLGANKKGKHNVHIPKYIGSVRAMVVASDSPNEAYGSAEKTVFVRKPLMVLASLPRKITPQETVTLPVTVFAMKPNIKNVKVQVEPNEAYTIVGDKTQTISFAQPDEKEVYFELKINDFNGIGKVGVLATSVKEKASYEVEIDVLNPNPITTETHDLVLKPKESKSLTFERFGTIGTNTATLELSVLPPMNFTKRMEYLIQYPHGCVEQTTSSAFPQLYFTEIFDITKKKAQKIERNIKATIQRLSKFQLSNGGLSYWQGGTVASDWGTSYAAHFLLSAEKKGYALPIGFKEKWITYQKQKARNWRHNASYDDSFSQAYRLYTLSLANSPDLSSMNRLRETKNISNQAKMRLASAYALIGKKSVANAIMQSRSHQESKPNYYYNYGSVTRNKAMELETYTLLNDTQKAIQLAKEVAKQLSSDKWMSTQTAAYSLLAISEYALKNGVNSGIKAKYVFNKNKESVKTSKSLFTDELGAVQEENHLKITNKGESVLYVRAFNSGILPVGEERILQNGLTAKVTYSRKTGEDISPKQLQQGLNFVAEVSIKNVTNQKVENVALTQYLPSGWEVINTRFTDFGNHTESSEVDYTDIRDASISYYFSLKAQQTKTFRILLNASYLGTYYLPGIQCGAMYDNNYIVRTKGEWVEVVK